MHIEAGQNTLWLYAYKKGVILYRLKIQFKVFRKNISNYKN